MELEDHIALKGSMFVFRSVIKEVYKAPNSDWVC